MKHIVWSHAVTVSVLALVACSPPEPAASPSSTLAPSVEPAERPPAPPAPTSEPNASEPDARRAETSLPAPKPTTISLARTGDRQLDAQLKNADAAFEAGDLEAALSLYEAARKGAPKSVAPSVGLARVKIAKASPNLSFAAAEKNRDVLAASKDLKRAMDGEPEFGPAFVEYGRALLLLGDAAQAESALRRGVHLLGEEAEAHSALGVALLANGKAEEALGALTRAKDLDPGSAARRGNLGTVFFMRGRVPEAIREYEIQVQLLPNDARAHSDLGTALLAQSDFTRALPELRRAIELEPKRATFRSNLGYALQLQGRISGAIVEYREAIRLDPKLASAWINLATALARDPKTRGEARRALNTANGLDPTDPRVKANLEELDALEKGTPAPSPEASPRRSEAR